MAADDQDKIAALTTLALLDEYDTAYSLMCKLELPCARLILAQHRESETLFYLLANERQEVYCLAAFTDEGQAFLQAAVPDAIPGVPGDVLVWGRQQEWLIVGEMWLYPNGSDREG